MNSKNEEYLDGLLQSLKKDSNSGIAKTSSNSDYANANDLNSAIANSSENSDLAEIGQLLGKLDSGELLDSGMNRVLDSISAPADMNLPKYKIGEDIAEGYEKDADELALDEAIARAEAMELKASKPSAAEESLLEVAPEILIEDEADELGSSNVDDNTRAILDEMVSVTPEDEMGVSDLSNEITLDNLEIPNIDTSEPISEEMLDLEGMLDAFENTEKVLDDDSAELKAALSENVSLSPEDIVGDLKIPDAVLQEPEIPDIDIDSNEDIPTTYEESSSDKMSIEDIDKMMAELSEMAGVSDMDEIPAAEEMPVLEEPASESVSEEMTPEDIEKMMAEMGVSAEAEQPAAETTPASDEMSPEDIE
ncbi:hypothetical protein, partial [Butyrivibrio sp. AC2005]|uniref:hypothetical protein n=1 Tax=Butyrivibrio sp. AC2005 TaxID=1280672 RepID=UPI0005D15997